jgi:aspartate ammonia-lyase
LELADPTIVINLKRALVEVHDPELRALQKALTGVTARKEKGRNDFESSVGVLFYMLGFESVRIGAVRKLSDGPDIYALAPQRDALVVECTAAAFNEDKLERLTGKKTAEMISLDRTTRR